MAPHCAKNNIVLFTTLQLKVPEMEHIMHTCPLRMQYSKIKSRQLKLGTHFQKNI